MPRTTGNNSISEQDLDEIIQAYSSQEEDGNKVGERIGYFIGDGHLRNGQPMRNYHNVS